MSPSALVALAAAGLLLRLLEKRGEYTYDEVSQKRSIAEPDCCEICQDCEDEGWIDQDAVFSSGDDEPPFHPNCKCDVEYKDRRVRNYG